MQFELFANHVKDAALQKIARWFINRHQLKQLGRMTALRLDSAAQVVKIELDLQGEPALIELTVNYRILSPTMIEIVKVQASRQWMTHLLNELVPPEKKRLEVPASVTRALSKF